MPSVFNPPPTDEWLALGDEALPVAGAYEWAVRADCGAVVLFSGTVRDHADGRDGVEQLVYEAYEPAALGRFAAIAAEARRGGRRSDASRCSTASVALAVGECAVVVVVSAPHRDEAFEAARFAIDTLKATVPIWKHETWADGADWGTDAQPIATSTRVGSAIDDLDHPRRGRRRRSVCRCSSSPVAATPTA